MVNGIEATRKVGQQDYTYQKQTPEASQSAQPGSIISTKGIGNDIDVNSHNVTNINIFTGDDSGRAPQTQGGDGSIFDQAKGCGQSEQNNDCPSVDGAQPTSACQSPQNTQPSGTDASQQVGQCESPTGAEASQQAGQCESPTGVEASQQAGNSKKTGQGQGSQSKEEQILTAFAEAIQEVTEQEKGKAQGASGAEQGQDCSNNRKGNVEQMQGGENKENKKELKEQYKEFDENINSMLQPDDDKKKPLDKGTIKELVKLTAEKVGSSEEEVLKTLNGIFDQAKSQKSDKSQEKQAA
jgi:hypothetical protein